MARRGPDVEQRLIALNTIADDPSALAPYLRDSSAHVVAKAARRIRDRVIAGLDDELRTAFDRHLTGSHESDPGCTAKLALIEALDVVDHDHAEPFRVAARLRQLEPSFGNPVDTACPVRVRGALGLVRLREPDVLAILTEHLVDRTEDLTDQPSVQAAAARALAEHGDPAGGHLVRLRLLVGISDGDVLVECLYALLVLNPAGDALDYVSERLDAPDDITRHAAALALGEAACDGAFERLRGFWQRSSGTDREVARTALELMRSDQARAFLAELDAE